MMAGFRPGLNQAGQRDGLLDRRRGQDQDAPMIALLSAAALIAASGQAATEEPVRETRAFLETFVANPQATKDMATSDARMVVDGVGGPYAEILSTMHDQKPAGCRVEALAQKPTPPAATMRGYPPPSFRTPGHFALVTATYQCPGRGGEMQPADVTVYLKDGRVVLFSVETRLKDGKHGAAGG
jgi:hypothetical protein